MFCEAGASGSTLYTDSFLASCGGGGSSMEEEGRQAWPLLGKQPPWGWGHCCDGTLCSSCCLEASFRSIPGDVSKSLPPTLCDTWKSLGPIGRRLIQPARTEDLFLICTVVFILSSAFPCVNYNEAVSGTLLPTAERQVHLPFQSAPPSNN